LNGWKRKRKENEEEEEGGWRGRRVRMEVEEKVGVEEGERENLDGVAVGRRDDPELVVVMFVVDKDFLGITHALRDWRRKER